MLDDINHTPVPFTPDVEVRADDEAETIQALSEQIRLIQETTAKDYGTAVRGVHAKGHAIVKGKLEVLSGLAPELAQGLFSAPGSYDALLRFSTLPGDILDDSVSVPRGLAIKLFDVPGDRLPGSESDTRQSRRSRIARGMAWRPISRSAASIGLANRPTSGRCSLGASETAARSTSFGRSEICRPRA